MQRIMLSNQDCSLLLKTMFRGFTGTNDAGKAGKESSYFISPIPTPPLGRTGKIRHSSAAPVGGASKNSGTCVRQQFERLQMADDDANQQENQELVQISNKSERKMQQNMTIDDLTRQLEDISKFSLEWFEIKREIEVIKRRRDRTKQHHSDFRRSI